MKEINLLAINFIFSLASTIHDVQTLNKENIRVNDIFKRNRLSKKDLNNSHFRENIQVYESKKSNNEKQICKETDNTKLDFFSTYDSKIFDIESKATKTITKNEFTSIQNLNSEVNEINRNSISR